MGKLIYGTSSWSEKSWAGAFYPEGMQPGDYLRHYATQFSAVGADVTYYRVPSVRMVSGWEEKTPAGFKLAAKFPRSIVHAGEGPRPDASQLLIPEAVQDDTDYFLRSMSLMGDKCGPLVLQFPYFNKQAFESPEPFFERLDLFLRMLPKDFRYAVEIRNKAWVGEYLLGMLRHYGAALVLLDLAYMPHADELGQRFDLLTTDFTYIRLIGDRKKTDAACQGSFDRIRLDMSDRLERWGAVVQDSLGRVPETYAFANNHYAGHGPATIRQLAALVGTESQD